MKILYSKNNTKDFDMGRFLGSLKPYGEVNAEDVKKLLNEDYHYDPLHVSCLVEIGARLIPDVEQAKEYLANHREKPVNFDRLRRITGYLVGTLDRWNDGKKAEERDRVKHSVDNYKPMHEAGQYSVEEKLEKEAQRISQVSEHQDELHKGV